MTIALQDGDARVLIEPRIGGAIAAYSMSGRDILRPALPQAAHPAGMSCFPLVPFANRIAYGIFAWQGRIIQLHPNFAPDPHAIHGQGWLSAWQIAEQKPARAVLVFAHEPGEWPWAYRATLDYSLDRDGLHAKLSLTNGSDAAMPASLGFHPYFPHRRQSRLEAVVDGMWRTDKTLIPTVLAAPILDFAKGAALATAPLIDNCFTHWGRSALIDQPGGRTVLRADADFLQIYIPEEEDYFCVEPATAMPDAVHRVESAKETGLLALAPGATVSLSMTITAGDSTS
ncbi:MAG TPA: aldose 1-epimerase [Rhizomicrobium sp.]|nr:aldose 1-epimerase [Rhizomicrobium sp.]